MTFRDKDRTPIFQTRLDDALQGESRESKGLKESIMDYRSPTDRRNEDSITFTVRLVALPPIGFTRSSKTIAYRYHPSENWMLPTADPSLLARLSSRLDRTDYDLESLDMVFLEKSRSWLEKQVENHPDQPFFLYHAMQAVHLPSFAEKSFQGKSGAGPHGDFLFEMDHIVGELLKTLERLVWQRILWSSLAATMARGDNHGAHANDHGHDPAYPWRGVKRDNWEGGHRVPLIASWPKKIAPAVSDRLVCLTDVMATCAAITGVELPENSAEDSFLFLPEAVDDTVRGLSDPTSFIKPSSSIWPSVVVRGSISITWLRWQSIRSRGNASLRPS